MALNEWQHDFLRRLIEPGSLIVLPRKIVNEELDGLIKAKFVLAHDEAGTVRYQITEAGRAAYKATLGK